MTTTLNTTDQLIVIAGAEHVSTSGKAAIVAPADTQQVAEILRFASQSDLKVSPIGGGTKQGWGRATQPDIYLSLVRLNRVLEHPWQDLTCTVQAGCTWATMQQALAQHGQFVALDPLWPEKATVGGILATNDSGVLRHRYGSLRDLVLGMTLVLADGTIARSGGKVVKNVAGYDLPKLMTGSLGTLAIITEATFRLHPLPEHLQSFTVHADSAAKLSPLMQEIRASHLLTQALQLRGDADGFHLDVQLNAHPEAKQEAILRQMIESYEGLKYDSGGSSGLQTAESGPATNPGFSPGLSSNVWGAREALFALKDPFIAKIGTLPADVGQIADDIIRLGGSFVAQSLGVIYAVFPNIQRNYSPLGSLYAYTDAGSMHVIQTPSNPLDDAMPPWGRDKPDPLMQAVKHQFDPNNTLNPL